MRILYVVCSLLVMTATALVVAPTASAHACHAFAWFTCGGCNDDELYHWHTSAYSGQPFPVPYCASVGPASLGDVLSSDNVSELSESVIASL